VEGTSQVALLNRNPSGCAGSCSNNHRLFLESASSSRGATFPIPFIASAFDLGMSILYCPGVPQIARQFASPARTQGVRASSTSRSVGQAVRVFSERGYHATFDQRPHGAMEIASGSIYKGVSR